MSMNKYKLNHRLLIGLLAFLFVPKICFAGVGPIQKDPVKKAYIIALGEFEETTGWPTLSVERDVYYLEKSFEVFGFKKENIHTYLNQKTTKKDVVTILNNAVNSAKWGDIIHLHFSGMGGALEKIMSEKDQEKVLELKALLESSPQPRKMGGPLRIPKNAAQRAVYDSIQSLIFNLTFERAIVLYDAPINPSINPLLIDSLTKAIVKDERDKYLTATEIIYYVKQLSKIVGPNGQLILSIDACYSGPNEDETKQEGGITVANRGGVFELTKEQYQSPIVIFSASLSNQLSYETRDSANFPVGVWSYAFYLSAIQQQNQSFRELAKEIAKNIASLSGRQTPVAAGNLERLAYQSSKTNERIQLPLPEKLKDTIFHNVFVLSIGVSEYILDNKSIFAFNNAASDAVGFVDFVKNEFELLKGPKATFWGKALINQHASKENILKALNEIISKAKPDDYFFFNFSGLSWELEDELHRPDIYFYPMLNYDVSDTSGKEFKRASDKIGLRQLKELFEFVTAQNQLIISEAGATPNFQKLFAKSLIESSPTIAELSKRNRVIIAPSKFGYDECRCNRERINKAPISYYLSLNQKKGLNVFSLFSSDENETKKYEYETVKREVECGMHEEPYTTFFHERKFIETLQYFTEEEVGKSRSLGVIQFKTKTTVPKIGEKHALIIGVNNYVKGAPTWGNLENPIEDAKDIELVLREVYGFETKLMLDAQLDSVLSVLKAYSNSLQENDQFVLFIAGHGDYDPYFFDDGFLVLSNSLSFERDPNRRTYLPFSQIRNIVDNLPSKQVLMLVDICFGGAFDSKISSGLKRSGNANYADVSLSKILQYKIDLKTRIVLSSGSVNEVPDGLKGRNSPFASRIIAGLRTGGGDRKVLTTIQLFEFIQWLPSKPVRGELPGNEGGAEFFLIAN